ncbi:31633_t:CDS:2 [Gigaspora margarita]|uniref:31633_t:CDS:1 n=1 Tax=Gigaspora margarita TaxID=4874 RepID=A0ABN7XGF3_GIGMA|nr:31633_t:CDS:2 [Gigaspora margarita]
MSSVSGKVNHINTLIAWLCAHLPPTVGKPPDTLHKSWYHKFRSKQQNTKSEMLFGTMEKVSSDVMRIGLHDSGSDNSGKSGSTNDSSRISSFS